MRDAVHEAQPPAAEAPAHGGVAEGAQPVKERRSAQRDLGEAEAAEGGGMLAAQRRSGEIRRGS